MQGNLVNDNKVVNATQDWQLRLCGLDAQEAIKVFKAHMEMVKAKEYITTNDITQVAWVKSMLYISNDQLPKNAEKMLKFQWEKEFAKVKTHALKNSNTPMIQELQISHDAWKMEIKMIMMMIRRMLIGIFQYFKMFFLKLGRVL